ncbi:MAG TPA: TonB-dependent receptor [Daejeonella sp.]|nr:TonB-dependent receptor [Daejeonella sp.]
MCKIFTRLASLLVLFLVTSSIVTAQIARAQNVTVSGTVIDKQTNEPLAGVAVSVKGKTIGTSTNENGKFSFVTSENTPFTIEVSYLGYKTVTQTISGSVSNLMFALETQAILGQEVVIAASRTPEKILESPVSIERVNSVAVRETAAPSFYDALANLKGVETSAQSLTFKSINTRGFNSNGNTRFNQFIDGMDNQAPGLNFAVGNVIGISELDLDNVELLPGASSALYGAGGMNGTMLMSSKNPFASEGVSFQLKTGLNHLNDITQGSKDFQDVGIRLAKAWNNRVAFKTTISYLQAKDWQANNLTNFDRVARMVKNGNRSTDPNYDGINVYGDEVSQNMRNVANSVLNAGTSAFVKGAMGLSSDPTADQIAAFKSNPATLALLNGFLSTDARFRPFFAGINTPGLLPSQAVSRTGYEEVDLVDYGAKSFKTSTSLYYKLNNTIQLIGQANWGSGTSVYTGTDRYSLRNFSIGQYKLELNGQDFMLRGYTTQERSGDSYIASILGSYINEASKPSTAWFPEYVGNYVGARSAGLPDAQAHAAARAAADQGRFVPGTPAFATAKRNIMDATISSGSGAKFNDKTDLWHYEGMYNFTNAFNNVVEFQAGASFRQYDLNSGGTIFDDLGRKIYIPEYGGFAQLGKKMLDDKLKLTVAGRYDKSKNFEGRFTPRVTGVLTVAPDNNLRVSYQTGYRNPTTQNQYIDLSVGGGVTRLIGGLPGSLQKYNLYNNKPFTSDSYFSFLNSAAAGTPNPALLQPYTFSPKGVQSESMQAWELGYKGLLGTNVLIDAYGYYNQYKDFITAVEVYQQQANGSFTKFGVPVNATGRVNTYGWALGMDYMIEKFNVSGNVSYNQIGSLPANFINDFNTPKFRYNLGVSNRNVFKNVGFNVNYRWQQQFQWASSFATGNVPSYGTVDAQVNLKVPSIKTMLKVGGSNIGNKYYFTSYGNPAMGGMYYIGLSFNQ